MRTITSKKIIVVLFFLFVGIGIQSTQAQFWKKLEKRVSEEVEEAVIRKTAEKSVEKVEKSVDSIFETPSKTRKKRKKKNHARDNRPSENEETVYDENKSNEHEIEVEETSEVYNKNDVEEFDSPETNTSHPASGNYSFEWKYVLKIESEEMRKKMKDKDFKITYFLSSNSTAFASKFEMGNNNPSGMGSILMVMDMDTGTNLMLMEINGEKIIQKMPSVFSQDIDQDMERQSVKDYTIVKIGTKTILGYQCQGFKITNEDGVITSYIAKKSPVNFNRVMSGNSKFKPKGFKTSWLKEFKNGLMLEMQFISNKKKKHNMKMTCVELKKEPFSIRLSDYKSYGSK